jgi:hypothetical protein|tara:strand:- start:310 stop:660 length:351 start_codon:yes stop_codon:yes gene_type:complete
MEQEVVPKGFSFNGLSGFNEGVLNGHIPKQGCGISKVLEHKFCFTPFTHAHLHAASDSFGTIISNAEKTKTVKTTNIAFLIETILAYTINEHLSYIIWIKIMTYCVMRASNLGRVF